MLWLDVTEIADLFASDDPYPLQADGTRANMELWIGWRGLLVVNLLYGALPVVLLAGGARLFRRFGPRVAAGGASGQPVR